VTGGAPPPLRPVGRDVVFVDGLVRAIEVGILPEEFGVLQSVRFTVRLEIDALPASGGDDRPAASYLDVVEAVDALTSDRRTGLLETLAEHLAARLLAHEAVACARIRIEKLDVLAGEATVGVELVRERTVGAAP